MQDFQERAGRGRERSVSTVLWANLLVDGTVECESEDRHALYKHADRLEAIAKKLELPSFLGICDTTDVRFNLDEFDLPEGVESTTEVMALEGIWLPLPDAILMLERLLSYITENRIRFGLFSDASPGVIKELQEVLVFARAGIGRAQKFNFCVVT